MTHDTARAGKNAGPWDHGRRNMLAILQKMKLSADSLTEFSGETILVCKERNRIIEPSEERLSLPNLLQKIDSISVVPESFAFFPALY